jgi:hypothetical protein
VVQIGFSLRPELRFLFTGLRHRHVGFNLDFSVRPNGAVHQWRKDPPKKLSVGLGS